MSLEDKELMQFKVGKKEQYAARMAFFILGFAISTWAPMIPMIKERLHIEADCYTDWWSFRQKIWL